VLDPPEPPEPPEPPAEHGALIAKALELLRDPRLSTEQALEVQAAFLHAAEPFGGVGRVFG
jgi:hypothetical protein